MDTNCEMKDSIGENLLGVRMGGGISELVSLAGVLNSYSHNSLLRRRSQKSAHCCSSSALCFTRKARDTRVHLLLLSSDRRRHQCSCRPSHGAISPFSRRGIPITVFRFRESHQSLRVAEALVFDISRSSWGGAVP